MARKTLLVGCAVAGAAFALAVALLQRDRYEAEAKVLFGRTTPAQRVLAGNADAPRGEAELDTDLAIASLDRLALRTARLVPGVSPAEIDEAVKVERQARSELATVTARWSSARGAALIANAFADQAVAVRREFAEGEYRRAIDAVNRAIAVPPAAGSQPLTAQLNNVRARLSTLLDAQTGVAQVVQRAAPPSSPAAPPLLRSTVVGGVGGLLAGLLLVVPLARLEGRIRTEDQLLALVRVPVLARIPDPPPPGRAAKAWTTPEGAVAFDDLRRNVEIAAAGTDGMVVAVFSPTDDDSATTVAAGLASAYTADGVDVVVTELDGRRSGRRGDLAPEHGVDGSPRARSHAEDPDVLFVEGRALEGPPEVRELLARLARRARRVLVAVPGGARTDLADAAVMDADCVLLVGGLGTTRSAEVLAARRRLRQQGALLLGLVVMHAAPATAVGPPSDDGDRPEIAVPPGVS